jgi:MFS family permease
MALAIFSLGVPFGQALGIAFGAKIAELYEWRVAFTSLGIAGVVLSIVFVIVVREPKRGRMDVKLDVHMMDAPPVPFEQEKAKFFDTMRDFFGRPVLFFAAISCGAAAFVGYAVLAWTTPLLQRDKGMTLGEIALYYSIFTAVVTGLGTWLAGDIVDRLVRRSKMWYGLLPALAFALAIPFYVGFVLAPTWQIALAFLTGPAFLNIFYLAPALALVQNSVKPNQRTMSGAMLLFVLNMIGLGFGPTFVGTTSTALVPQYGQESLQMAMVWLTPFYLAAVAAHLCEAWAIKREDATGIPSRDQMNRNLMLVKIVIGAALLVLINLLTIKYAVIYWTLTAVLAALVLWGIMDFVTGKGRPGKAA